MNNLSSLTVGHRASAYKKRAKREQVKEILFDDEARRDYLTGFRKRNLLKKEASKKRREEREKLERQELRRDNRKMLAERAVQNAMEVEQAYGRADDDQDEWKGASTGGDDAQEAEFEGEEQMATVTVVEDFDPASLIYGPSDPVIANEEPAVDKSGRRILPSSRQTAQAPVKKQHTSKPLLTGVRAKEKKKPKDIKYLTIADRKVAKRKQFARHTEKAERAGGKQSRKPSSGRRRLERK